MLQLHGGIRWGDGWAKSRVVLRDYWDDAPVPFGTVAAARFAGGKGRGGAFDDI